MRKDLGAAVAGVQDAEGFLAADPHPAAHALNPPPAQAGGFLAQEAPQLNALQGLPLNTSRVGTSPVW
jgi:hypothetical protein